MKYTILQMKDFYNEATDTFEGPIPFFSYSVYEKKLGKLTDEVVDQYWEKVYEGEIEGEGKRPESVLENLFRKFNIDHPSDFKGHSLSTSDIVILDGKKWFCDDIGWQPF